MRVVITGASRGIGKEFVHQNLLAGHEVHAVSRNAERLKGLSADPTGKLITHSIDLSAKDGPAKLAAALEKQPVDLLINNAGVFLDGDARFTDLNFDRVRESFAVNTILPMQVSQALLPNLLAAGKSGQPARVAQITSLMGSIADNTSGGYYAYRMSKAALNMFNKSFSIDYPGITSVVFHPGWVKTDMGGEQAPTTTEESVTGMMKILSGLKSTQTGKFYDFEGDEIQW